MTRRTVATLVRRSLLAAMILAATGGSLSAQRQGRFLAKEDIILLGLGLRVEPAHQTVPKGVATIVSTFLRTSNDDTTSAPPFSSDAVVKATLRGPGLQAPLELQTAPNTPFNIPPLSVAGLHTLDDIRLESGGAVLMYGAPESVTIDVIDKLLVTQITSRPLTAAEIREKGIVFDRSNFQAYNFTAAFAVRDQPINIDFPVVLPRLEDVTGVSTDTVAIGRVDPPSLPSLKTIIPDTLRIQTQVPNLTVVGFSLTLEMPQGQELLSFPIPGVVIVPGNIGFLNQNFSVMLMVGNVAPAGSNLVVTDLKAEIVLPAGNDTVTGSPDDPLVMVRTATGESPRVQPIVQAGPDRRMSLAPGESGTAEYLVEGRREGTHVIEMEMSGTLNGLPVGPVPIRGRAAGSVLVRNPRFTLTFTHPEIVAAGEPYTLDVTVTNTSQSPANFVSLNLYPHQISGATLTGQNTREIESIPPGDSATVSFDLVSRTTGKVTAATLDSDENVSGRFALKTSVGELGVPLSPDSLILPKEARSLPKPLLDAAVGLLGKAWAVATAPAGALPPTVSRFSKQIVFDRAVEVAEAGFRVSLNEPVGDSVAQLATDFLGSNFPRLAELTSAVNLPFVTQDYRAFDELRRSSVRGDIFAQAVADVLRSDLSTRGVTAFHRQLAAALSYRPGHVAVLVGAPAGPLPVRVSIIDPQGRRIGGTAGSKVVKEIPFSDLLTFREGTGPATAELAIVAAPAAGPFIIRIEPAAGGAPDAFFTMSVVVPDASGDLRQVTYQNLTSRSRPSFPNAPGAAQTIAFDVPPDSTTAATPADNSLIPDPAPRILGVVQQPFADILTCGEGPAYYPGRIIAVLFSEEVTPASVQDRLASSEITKYAVDGNDVVGVALQPGRRIAFLALRDGIGPFVQRALTVNGVEDRRGQSVPAQTLPIVPAVTQPGGVVSGQLIEADGTPVSGNVRLFYHLPGGCAVGISSKSTGPQGHFSWDYVLKDIAAASIVGINEEKDTFRRAKFSIQRDGQRLNVNIVLLGRGTLQGRTLNEAGAALAGTKVKVTSLTDQSQYGTTSDEQGRFSIPNIPVGNVFVEAVNLAAKAQTNLSEHIPLAGGTTVRDIVLLNVDTTRIIVKTGTLSGHVLRSDGATPVADAPVIVYYRHLSQPGVTCPPLPSEAAKRFNHCPIAVSRTDQAGAFTFADITAGALIVESFDQATLQEGEGGVVLPADGTASVNVLLGAGLGVVKGVVLDATRQPVAGARVGGGLSLTTTAADGTFTLPDVPVGRREIVAVSDQLGSSGTALVDIVRAGEQVSATIILDALAAVAGTIYQPNGSTPVPNLKVYLFKGCEQGAGICVVGTAMTNATGGYRIDRIPLGRYKLSAFNATLTAGNVVPVELKYSGQVARADVTFRGGGGEVSGRVLDDDGQTPLKARVAISGDRIVSAGGMVGTGFTYVRNYQIADTDLSGRFSFNGLFVGEFALSAVGEFSPDPVTLTGEITQPGQAVQMDLRLQPTGRIAGTVVLPPLGAEPAGPNVIVKFKSDAVKIVCSAGSGGPRCTTIPQGIQEEVVVTDSGGRYLLPVVNAGPFTLTAEDPATGRSARVHGTIRAGEIAEIPIRLLAFSDLTVEVLGSNATTPIPGARVEVTQLEYPKKKLTFFADGQGRVVFSGADRFSEGELVVLATDVRNGFAGRASVRLENDGAPVTAKVYLYDESGTVKGTVTRADGTPAAFADVVISNCSPDGFGGCDTGGALAFAVTDASGYYEQSQIPAGAFSVEVFDATTGRHGFATGQMGGVNGLSVTVNVVEAALGLVKGAVLMGGTLAPLKGATLALWQRGLSGRLLPTLFGTSSVDGSFAFPGTTLGTFTLEARATKPEPGGFASVSAAISSEGQVVDVPIVVNILRPVFGTIAGTVYNAVGGTPAANSRVEICHFGIDCQQPILLTTGLDGRFALPRVPLGRFTVTVRSQNALNSASLIGELEFEDQVADLVLTLTGLRKVSGTVVFHGAGEQPAPNVEVSLSGTPSSGCSGSCLGFADANGNFSFNDVPADVFTVSARDPITGLRGAVGGSLAAAENKIVRIVLQPSGRVSGRVLTSANMPAAGVTAELILLPGNQASGTLFTESAANGEFVFTSVPIGPFRLQLQDPLGPGIGLRLGNVTGDLILGDITLDEAAPAVAATTPSAAAVGVPQNQVIQVVFSEPIDQGTITPENVVLSDQVGAVVAVLTVTGGDTTLSIAPIAPLKTETRYALKIRGVKDRLGKTMADFVLNFTTVDITPPVPIDLSPAPGTSGVSIDSPFRVKFSEPIDPTKLRAPPITMTSGAGVVDGQFALLFGNTVAVFTPARPLARGTTYRVQMGPVTDLSGNVQAAALDYTFSTTDGSAPEIPSLTASNNGVVVENGIATVVANVGAAHDIAVVDFYANGTLVASDRSMPFELRLQVTEAIGTPGTQVTIGALATDTSGNRGRTPAQTLLTVVADQPPTVAIATPASGISARNGDLIHVSVQSADDLGVAAVGFRAQTGKPQDAATRPISPAASPRTDAFSFYVPQDAIPGSTIRIEATAVDTKGQLGTAPAVEIVVLDAVPPTITITGLATGARVRPGQQANAIVKAEDAGGIASVAFKATGVAAFEQTRTIDPAQSAVFTSFTFTIPANALPGQALNLDAIATDRAGNVTNAARVILPIADLAPPSVQIRTGHGALTMSPGSPVTIIVDASDESSVKRIDLVGDGAFPFADSKQIVPPAGSAQASFTINVPAAVADGAVLNLQARATDISDNTSDPTVLTLTAVTVTEVALPPSVILLAGETVSVPVQLSSPAPAGGLRIDFASRDANVASVNPSLTIPEGQSSATLPIIGVAGGTVQIDASIRSVLRATMTATVRGGIVRGIVTDASHDPIAGAQVSLSDGVNVRVTTTNGAGEYFFEGYQWFGFSIKARHPEAGYGYATGQLSRQNGFAQVNVVLMGAGLIRGRVLQADGAPTGAGVTVSITAQGTFSPLASVITNDAGQYEFPFVTLGSYTIDAMDANGNRGRAPAALDTIGEELEVPVTYLGRGTVIATIRDGSDNPVPNAVVRFTNVTVFGYEPVVQISSDAQGVARFENVLVGEFQIEARDPVSGAAGYLYGRLLTHGEIIARDVRIGSFAALTGTVYRVDGTTPVPFARVTAGGDFGVFTTADQFGKYRFDFLRLGTFRIDASDTATGGRGTTTVTLSTNGQTVTRDITFVGQGSILVTVKNGFGTPVPNAWVTVRTNNADVGYEERNAVTGADGTVLFQRVLVGPFTVLAYSGSLFGTTAGSLANEEVRQATVQLQNTGTIAGTIYAPDGQTLAQSGTVYVHHPSELTFYPSGIAQTALDSSGTYRFDSLPLGTYNLSVRDAQGRLRAVVRTVVLATLGQIETRDMTMIGLGTVRGQVLFDNATSTPASSVPVEVRSLTPTLGVTATATTNAGGFYEVQNVVAGSFTVSAGLPSQQLLGEGSGAITAHGQIVVVDVVLQNNALNLPVTKWDANNQYYQIQRDAALAGSGGDLFSRTFHGTKGAGVLELISGSVTDKFTGSAIGTQEDARREIAVRQLSLAGVNVTRKVYVPQTGYFARYLDVLTNPTAAPITLDVRVSNILPREGYALVTTSSGDTTLATGADPSADRWVVFDDAESAFFTKAATAFVFDGPDAAQNAALLRVEDTTEPNCFFNSVCSSQRLAYTWTNVTIQPGESVAFVHFLVQQRRRASAIASAGRLAQLPPEALAGLSPGELDQIRNFVVPAEGSTLPPLPSVLGTVTGRLLEGDGVTTVPSAVQSVKFKTTSIYFDAEHLINTDATGRFTLTATFNEFGSNVIVPVEPFALNAQRHPLTQIQAPAIAVTFPAGSLTVEQDVAFTNAGLLRGVVRRHNGNVVTTGYLTAFSNAFYVSFLQIGTDGSYRMGGVPAGAVTVTATISHPQGSALTVNTILQAVAGQSVTADIVLPATGTVAGTVTNALGGAAPNVRVDLVTLPGSPTFFQRGMNTDSGGGFVLADVPAGDYQVRATDPATSVVTTANVRVNADQTTTQNLQLVGSGTVRVQALFTGGAAAAGAIVSVRDATGAFNRVATADATGRATFQNAPVGTLIVRAQNATAYQAVSEVTVSLPSHGATLDVTVTLPPVGTVQVQVNYTGGGGAAGAPVEIKHAGTGANFFQSAGNTDASGRLTIANVLGPSFTVRSRHPVDFGNSPEITGTLTAEGQIVPVIVPVPPVGSVVVQVNSTDGTPLSGIRVDVQDAGDTFFQFGGTTDANGRVTITRVRAAFTVQAYDPVNSSFNRVATGRVDTEGQTVQVTIVLGARGTVRGRVVDPFGNPVPPTQVDVLSENPSVRTTVLTAADGTYTAPDVPVGNFRAKVSDFTSRRAGWTYGSIARHGDSATADIAADKVFLTARLSDANAFQYSIGTIGELSGGVVLSPFAGSHSLSFGTGFFLANPFRGDFAGLPELGGRQIVLGNTLPFGGFPYVPEGLRITRKVYVPASGYFARYLEIFENVTDAPITRSIQVQASLAASFNARIATTSTGDATFDAADRWAIAFDSVQATRPIGAIVVAGDGAPVLLGQAGLTDSRNDQPFARWNNVTIPAGGRVMLMHFAVQQPSTAAAQASAERLVQLPPEALEGLTPDERAGIVNFAVPADGVSTLAPFTTLSGRVFAGDGATPVPGATVFVESVSPVFTRETAAVADASGAFTLTTLVPGAFQARAKHPVTGAFTPAVSGTISAGQTSAVQDFVFAGTGSVRGVVRFASGVPAFGARVRITGGPSPIDVTVDAGPDGGYGFGALPPGQYSLSATTPTRWMPATPLTIVAGETVTLDLRLLAVATLRVTTADKATNAPLPGVGVSLYAGGAFRGSRVTDASAVATFTDLWEETWTLIANGGGMSGQATVAIGPANDGQTIDVPIGLSGPVTGNVTGSVFAADGSTPVFTYVELVDPTRGQVASTYSGPSGFAFNNVTDNLYGLQIVVRSPLSYSDTVTRLVRLTTAGATVTENFTLTLSVIRGTVSFNDGTPVPYPEAFVTQTIGGVVRTFYADRSDDQGHYLVFGNAVGPFTLTAQDGASGLTAIVNGEVAALALPVTVDATLPVSGAVFGQVRDATGASVPRALVGLGTPAISFNRTVRADDQGNYRFERVALGPITVQGCNDAMVCGSAQGALTAGGQEIDIPIVLPAVGSIAGTVFGAFGGAAVASAQVFIENIAYSGPLRSLFQVYVGADGTGRFQSTQVPVGVIRVTANGSPDYTHAGIAETTLTAGESRTVDVVLGNAFRFGVFNLGGTDGFKYDVRCDGTLAPGGAIDGHLTNAYTFGYRAAIGAANAACMLSGPIDEGGRQITVGPSALSGLTLTRKIFSPAAGGFARYLEVLTNPTSTARTVTIEVSSSLGGSGAPESLVVLVAPSTTGNTFAITDLSEECCDPVLGHVFGGPGAPISASATRFVAGDDDVSYVWTVTVPAGQTIALMHFAIQREADGSAAARAQAEALAALTDPNALTGLTAAERAQIVNFVIR